VTFYQEGVNPFSPRPVLGSSPLANGVATLNLSSLGVGTFTITAQYSGDTTWAPAGRSITLTVAQAATATTISLAIAAGQLTLTAAVSPVAPGGGTPTGTVQFIDSSNNSVVANATLSAGGSATAPGTNAIGRPIVAVYSGDGNFKPSTSGPLPVPVNSAALQPATGFAPDELVSLFGVTGLNGDTAATLPLTTLLAGVTVKITDSAGVGRLAELYGVFGSAGQINLVIPGDTAPGLATVTITLPGGGTLTTVINVAGSAPGIFTAGMNGAGLYAGQVVHAHADGTQTITSSVDPIDMGPASDQLVLVLYGTGIRHATSVTATINGVSVPVAYFGAQGQYDGLDQVNLTLARSLAGAGLVNIVVTVDGQASNTVTVNIR